MPGELGFATGPYVNMAVFCERAMQETDGVLSIIRVIDQVNVQASGPDAPDALPPGGEITTTLVVMLKGGQARGTQSVQVVLEHPDTSRHEAPMMSVSFTQGEHSGANLVLPMKIQLTSAGLYWTDVLINERLATRVPLMVNYGFMRAPGTLSPG
jgi:hypothetical protein